MIWRTTLTHAIEGSVIISEPEGLSSSIIGLTRHPDFHSLVKEFKTSFKAYGTNGTYDGHREWIKNVESLHGCDSVIDILIEYAPDDYVFEVVSEGEVGIQTIVEALDFDHALEFTPVQLGFWRKAISRYDVPVDIQSAITIDGESASVVTPENLLLTSQLIEKKRYNYFKYALEQYYGLIGQMVNNGFEFIQLGFETGEENIIDEIGWNNIPTAMTNDVFPLLTLQESGDYIFNVKVTLGHNRPIEPNFCQSTIGKYIVYIKINGNPEIAFTPTDFTFGLDVVTEWVYSDTLTLVAGDNISIYVADEYDLSTDKIFLFGINGFEFSGLFQYGESFINIVAATTFPQSQSKAFLIHDVIASVIQRTTGLNSLYSELLGSPDTQSRVYAQPGCYSNNVALKGLHLRGYLLADKKFSISMKEIWDGLNPLMNLSLGYETIAGEKVIRIEKKEHCYDSSSMSVLLSGVQKIRRSYSDEYFNSVETGYDKGKIEDISGIDDPQKQTRASIFKNIGRKLQIISTWITQGLTIETTRRTTIVKSADYKYDNDTFMIEVTKTGSDYTPRLDEDYDSVTNLLNEATRYNKRWVPSRMFLRWSKYIFNGIQDYIGTVYRFVSGDGNYTMTSERKPDSCPDNYGGNSLAENADIVVTNEHLYIPQEFEIEHYLTFAEFKTIDENRNLAIGVSQSATGHAAFFIKDLQFEILSGQIKMKGFFKDKFNIEHIPPTNFIVQGGKIFDATFDFSFE